MTAPLKTVEAPSGARYKLGRRPRPRRQRPPLALASYLPPHLPESPATGHYSRYAEHSLADPYLNTDLGDCVIAAPLHALDVFLGGAGTAPPLFAKEQVVELYSEIGGYNPAQTAPDGTNPTDQGCDVQTMLRYWQQRGLCGHHIDGWVAVRPEQAKTAMWLFENLIFGLALPDAWLNPMPERTGFVWDVAGDPVLDNGHCFTSDTKISLLDGRELSFEDLSRGDAGAEFWVYSCDNSGNIVPGRAHSPRKTRTSVAIVEVELDNSERVRCTTDHLFLMRDGQYRKACELRPGDSLMPLYRRVGHTGYEEFYNPADQRWKSTHRTAAFGLSGRSGSLVVHHYDFDKRNNDPRNLIPMTSSAHNKLHYETSQYLLKYARSDEGRNTSRQLMQQLWSDPEWRAKMDAAIKTRTSAGGRANIDAGNGFGGMDHNDLVSMNRDIGKRATARLTSKENLTKAAEGFRKKLRDDPEFAAKRREQAVARITEYNERRRAEKSANNHKVVGVRDAGRSDVYDITVDEHHNFALSAGVFVHNCFVGVGWNSNGIIVDSWGLMGTVTYAAVAKYGAAAAGGELYAALSAEAVAAAAGRAPNGFKLDELRADLAALRS
jgi:intein/homing endonuclease